MDEDDERGLAALADEVASADVTVALTGAGVSAASGVRTFRGDDGVWGEEFDPERFRYGRFRAEPAAFWRDRLALRESIYGDGVEPNAAHEALAAMESAGALDRVLTQNTDGLHRAAGSDPIELHGTGDRVRCERCGATTGAEPVREGARDGELPPTCECGGVLKPDVVLFGERLDRDRLREARRLAAEADVFLAAGSSLTVDPAAALPGECSGTLAVCNYDSTRYDDRADYLFRTDVTELLPALAERVIED